MQSFKIEVLVGVFLLLALLCLGFLAVKVSGFSIGKSNDRYLVYSHFEQVGGLTVRSKVAISGVEIGQVLAIEYDQKTMLQNLVCYPGIGPILLREIFLKTKGWNHNYKYLPDFEYWLRLSDFGKFKRIPKTLGGYRIHPKSNHVRDVSIDQANEMYNLIVNYLTDKKFNKSINTKLSLATAALLSGKIHLKSRRFILAIKFFFKSLKLYHLIFFKRVFWSSIISALRIQLYK